MICSQCGNDNMAGRIFCLKCGTRLNIVGSRPTHKTRYGPAAEKREKSSKAPFIFMVIILLSITGILYLAISVPEESSKQLPNISEDNAKNCELKFRLLAHNGKEGKNFTVAITETELNSFITKGYIKDALDEIKKYTRQGNISVEDIRIKIASDNILLIVKTYVKFKYIYVCLAGKLDTKDGKAIMIADKVVVGKMPLPRQAGSLVAQIIRPGVNPLSVDLPDYVKNVKIEKDNLVITVGGK